MTTLAATLKNQLRTERQTIISTFLADGKPGELLTALRRSVDIALTHAWKMLEMPPSAALVAVGGYGRGELFPHSDVDVLILLDASPDAELRARLEQLVQLFWDIGLEIGHSIRTVLHY